MLMMLQDLGRQPCNVVNTTLCFVQAVTSKAPAAPAAIATPRLEEADQQCSQLSIPSTALSDEYTPDTNHTLV